VGGKLAVKYADGDPESRVCVDRVKIRSRQYLALALLLGASASSGCGGAARRATVQREAAYQVALQTYSEAVTPGMTRNDVERYFRDNGVHFQQMCCVDEKAGLDDLVKIGKEKHPWYCSEHNVYVAFEFTAGKPADVFSASDADRLRKVTIFHWLEGCL